MNLADVMGEIATVLAGLEELSVFGYPANTVAPPAAIVTYPDVIDFDVSYGRGLDRIPRLPVVLVIGKADEESARDRLGQYIDGSGDSSIKQLLESGTYTAFDTLAVTSAEIDVYTIGGTDYLGAVFYCDITGKGAL